MLGLLVLPNLPARADLTFTGASGFITVPSHTTIRAREFEFAAHTRMFHIQKTDKEKFLTNLAMGFSPVRDFEIGVQKAIDSRRAGSDFDPDPTVNFKLRLPSMGTGQFSECALGMIFDTNQNNYHSLYFSVGGCGVAWNFGGNPGFGTANFGSWDRQRKEPKSLCFIVGGEYPQPKPGERGYRHHYLLDYNGDMISLGWRFKSHRGFWIDAGWQSKSSYTDLYDYHPVFMGLGAIF